MINIEFAFEVGENVKINPLESTPGVVIQIRVDSFGIQYMVRYFCQGKAEEVCFFQRELSRSK